MADFLHFLQFLYKFLQFLDKFLQDPDHKSNDAMTVELGPTAAEPLSFSVRLGEEKDAGEIAALGAKVFYESFAWSMPAQDMRDYLDTSYSASAIQLELSDTATYRFWVARDDSTNKLLGFVQLNRCSDEPCLTVKPPESIELQRIYTDTAAHSRGVGSTLMAKALEYVAEQGYKAIWLGVWEENPKAQKFYKRNGFNKVGTHDFVMGSCVQTDWILERIL
ncbi:uncharacterized protein PSANT_05698 [Moesziomyces antarcticus]|uniref:N-acetyltransferase domain-containing protein n=1 Tax=Pseudozyma antarctica TaxID=84753 RepID=A0A5C3FUY8_PSEA2|nr:uncharacterized protein PSANT_05698 [Moesziomyces antarcticus]